MKMPTPWKHPDTGIYHLRLRVPADLVALIGKRFIKRTLGTKDHATAKALFIERHAALSKEWATVRAGPQPLSRKQMVALSGMRYRDNVKMLGENPENAAIWKIVIRRCDAADATPECLEATFGAITDTMLEHEGLLIDAQSRALLLKEVCRADREAAEYLLRNSMGDYGPEPNALRYPVWEAVRPTVEAVVKVPVVAVSLTHLFSLWKRDHLANNKSLKSVGDFEHKIGSLINFIGHEDAEAITSRNIADWTEHLRHDKGLAAKTVRHKYLSAVSAVYKCAIGKIIVTLNPATIVDVKLPKRIKTRPRGFTDSEAAQVLSHALSAQTNTGRMSEHNALACQWVPWICAYTGARGGEITQLRKEDLLTEYGIVCLRITPEAGSVKTGHYRLVPLHSHLLDLGLVAFIQSRPPGPLFYPASHSTRTNGSGPAERPRDKVAEWVRKVAGIKDPRVQPNHGWRHRFKTVGRDVDVDLAYLDAIQGHDDGRAATEYGETTMKALHREVQKFPRYDLSPS